MLSWLTKEIHFSDNMESVVHVDDDEWLFFFFLFLTNVVDNHLFMLDRFIKDHILFLSDILLDILFIKYRL